MMMFRNLIAGVTAAALTTIPAMSIAHPSYDNSHEPILVRPIGDVPDDYWYDYLADIREAEHELEKDLHHATDAEDRRDALDEYRTEIADANKDYKKEMRERGYRVGRVTIGE